MNPKNKPTPTPKVSSLLMFIVLGIWAFGGIVEWQYTNDLFYTANIFCILLLALILHAALGKFIE